MSDTQDSCRHLVFKELSLSASSRISIALERARESGWGVFIASHSIEEVALSQWPWQHYIVRISLYYTRDGERLPEGIIASLYEALLLVDAPKIPYDAVLGDMFFLSVRLQNCLHRVGIKTIEEMRWVVMENVAPSSESKKTQIPVFPDMSRRSFLELRGFLREYDEYMYTLYCS